MVEPWLRGTHTELPAVVRQVVHALELAVEDQVRWCGGLSEKEMEARPLGLPSVGFQMRHMVRSLDRLLTYAEGGGLSDGQMEALRAEHDGGVGVAEEFRLGMLGAEERVVALAGEDFEAVRVCREGSAGYYAWGAAGALCGAYAEAYGTDGEYGEGCGKDARWVMVADPLIAVRLR